jgi:hypothetical protein
MRYISFANISSPRNDLQKLTVVPISLVSFIFFFHIASFKMQIESFVAVIYTMYCPQVPLNSDALVALAAISSSSYEKLD